MRISLLYVLAAVLLAPSHVAAITYVFTAIAESGDAVPSSASTFTSFERPSIDGGLVAFRAQGTAALDGVYKIDHAQGGALERVADTTTTIPSGSGSFAGFADFVSVDSESVAFAGQIVFLPTADEGEGVYLDDGTSLSRIFDGSVPVDGQLQGAFPYVSGISLDGTEVAFGVGILPFLVAVAEIGGSVSSRFDSGDFVAAVADNVTQEGPEFRLALDGGEVFFRGTYGSGSCSEQRAAFSANAVGTISLEANSCVANAEELRSLSASGGALAFYITSALFGQDSIQLDSGSGPIVVVQESTPLPEGGGTFGNMNDVRVSLDAGSVAFHTGFTGARAVYATLGGELERVLGPGDALDGRTVDDVDLDIEALSGDDIALRVAFTNGDSGIYLATLVGPPAIPVFGIPGMLGLGLALLLSGRAALISKNARARVPQTERVGTGMGGVSALMRKTSPRKSTM